MKITNEVINVGVTDRRIDLFEGQYKVPDGMTYNSYLILDRKIAVLDTVDRGFTHEWFDNLESALGGREPDYLIVSHMEPDHSANILNFMHNYKNATIVSSEKAFAMMSGFFGTGFEDRRIVVGEGGKLDLGGRELVFYTAPMVHWPEVVVTYDPKDKILFSADGFGKFGATAGGDWAPEARRYYFGIVGKYGVQVQALLKKASALDIEKICPLHGPVLSEKLEYYLGLYSAWSSYAAESDGVVIAYTSVYGNTKKAVDLLAEKLSARGCPEVVVCDLARCDLSGAVADAFRCGKLVLATTTYNADVFPFMKTFIEGLTERGFRGRTVAMIENGSWAPLAAKTMRAMLENSKNITFAEPVVTVKSALDAGSSQALDLLADNLCRDYIERSGETADKKNMSALFNIGYGLYVVTSNDGKKDNGLIVNTVAQVTSEPNRVAVTINKDNYSHHIIRQTGVMNVNCLSTDAPFSVFETFGFCSGRNVDKFKNTALLRSDNGLAFLTKYINSFMSLKVEQYIDLGTHGMFVCAVTEARVISQAQSMTYSYYFANVKPKPDTEGKKGFVCKVCGYVYEGDELPDDFVCPLCKHGAADFEPIK